jgi:hypothetical protein
VLLVDTTCILVHDVLVLSYTRDKIIFFNSFNSSHLVISVFFLVLFVPLTRDCLIINEGAVLCIRIRFSRYDQESMHVIVQKLK